MLQIIHNTLLESIVIAFNTRFTSIIVFPFCFITKSQFMCINICDFDWNRKMMNRLCIFKCKPRGMEACLHLRGEACGRGFNRAERVIKVKRT